jgi:hypothetical protein
VEGRRVQWFGVEWVWVSQCVKKKASTPSLYLFYGNLHLQKIMHTVLFFSWLYIRWLVKYYANLTWAENYDLSFCFNTRKHTSYSTKEVCKFLHGPRTTTTNFASVSYTYFQYYEWVPTYYANLCLSLNYDLCFCLFAYKKTKTTK